VSATGTGGNRASRRRGASGRTRRPRTVLGSLAMIVLAVEFVIIFLAALVIFGLKNLPAWQALGGGGVLLVLVAIAAATARSRVGIVLGWIVQVLFIAAAHYDLAVGVVGVIFAALWVYCMIVGGRIDRRDRAAAARS
jgi:Protein of unknown function (DUF4233)